MSIDTTPPISDSGPASGRFVLRIDPSLHWSLRQVAQDAGVSLNEFCARKLAHPSSGVMSPGGEAAAKLAAWFGDSLIGIVCAVATVQLAAPHVAGSESSTQRRRGGGGEEK